MGAILPTIDTVGTYLAYAGLSNKLVWQRAQRLDGADGPGLAHISIPHDEGRGTIARSTRTAST